MGSNLRRYGKITGSHTTISSDKLADLLLFIDKHPGVDKISLGKITAVNRKGRPKAKITMQPTCIKIDFYDIRFKQILWIYLTNPDQTQVFTEKLAYHIRDHRSIDLSFSRSHTYLPRK